MNKSSSPIKSSVLPKVYERIGLDQRDHMIRKLKEDLIISRSKIKEIQILQHYLSNLLEKTQLLELQKQRIFQENRSRLESIMRVIHQEKKQFETAKNELKMIHKQLSHAQDQYNGLQRHIKTKTIEADSLKNQGFYFYAENQKLIDENYKLRTNYQICINQNKRIDATIIDIQSRCRQFNNKIFEVRSYMSSLKDQETILKERLHTFEKENNQIGYSIDTRENNIDQLEKIFVQKHQMIKDQVQYYIQLEHQNEKFQQQMKHKFNLQKIQIEKQTQLTNLINNIEKTIAQRKHEKQLINHQNNSIEQGINSYQKLNQQMKKDLLNSQMHLQNLLTQNTQLNTQLDNYFREDQAIIQLIQYKRKKISLVNNYRSNKRY